MHTLSQKSLQHPELGRLLCVYACDINPQFFPTFGLTAPPDPIGEIWELSRRLPFLGVSEALTVWIHSSDWADVLAGNRKEGEFAPLQIDAYLSFQREIASIEAQVSQAVFKHYHGCLERIDYGHADFKPVASVAPLILECDRWQLRMHWEDSGPRQLHITARCPWDTHGFSAYFENEQLVRLE